MKANIVKNLRHIFRRHFIEKSFFETLIYLTQVGKRVLLQAPFYNRYLKQQVEIRDPHRCIFLNTTDINYSRYLYTLIKFFNIEGYQVILPAQRTFFYQLKADRHTQYILKEKLVIFAKSDSAILHLSLNSDYFRALLAHSYATQVYHIPIAQHPFLYTQQLWNTPIHHTMNRKHSMFMIGSFSEDYQQIKKDGIFDCLSRLELYQTLQQKNHFLSIKTTKQWRDFLLKAIDHKIILIDTAAMKLPLESLRVNLAKFHFFMALPGLVMPLCHNIIEAMSVACIPVLQKKYAQLFRPALQDGVNAIVFEDLKDLYSKIEVSFHLNQAQLQVLHQNVLDYYATYLTPAAVIGQLQIAIKEKKQVFLLAEHHSVEKLMK